MPACRGNSQRGHCRSRREMGAEKLRFGWTALRPPTLFRRTRNMISAPPPHPSGPPEYSSGIAPAYPTPSDQNMISAPLPRRGPCRVQAGWGPSTYVSPLEHLEHDLRLLPALQSRRDYKRGRTNSTSLQHLKHSSGAILQPLRARSEAQRVARRPPRLAEAG